MPSLLAQYRAFFQQFVREFHTTGAIVPSSAALARALTEPMRAHGRPCRIVEVGPGTGAVTKMIVPLLGPEDRLDLVELNDAFVALLRRRLDEEDAFVRVRDHVRLLHQPVQDLKVDVPYDFIISGLPLNNFPAAVVEEIFETFSGVLAPGGVVSYFEYMYVRPVRRITSGRAERLRLRQLDEILRQRLARGAIARRWVFRNLPPAWVHHLHLKEADSGTGQGA